MKEAQQKNVKAKGNSWAGGQKTPRGWTLPCGLIVRLHYNEQVFVREVGEKEKQDGLFSMRRGRTGDSRIMKNSLI